MTPAQDEGNPKLQTPNTKAERDGRSGRNEADGSPMKSISVVLCALFFASFGQAQQAWTRTCGGTGSDGANSVQQTSDGGYIIAGYTGSFGAGDTDVYLVKTNASGDTLWTRTYGGTSFDEGWSVQQTSDGGYVIAGTTYSFGAGDCDVYLIKTDASGDTLWTRTYGGTNEDKGRSVRQTSDGGYIIAGYTCSFGAADYDVYLIKTNASGDTLWTKTYGRTNDDEGWSVQQTSDGGYIITGTTASVGTGGWDVYLLKTNASGDTLWTRTYGGMSYDYGSSVQQTSDGGYIVAGWTESFGAGGNDVYLVKTNASGDTIWTRTCGGIHSDEGNSVLQTSDGSDIIVGETWSFGAGGEDVYLIETDASGDTLWTRTCGGTSGDWANSVQQTSDGGYIIAGVTASFGAGGEDVYLIKTDANGSAVEEPSTPRVTNSRTGFRVEPNPFGAFAVVPGHETERFTLSDISGRQVGISSGSRIGEGLAPGVYFVSPVAAPAMTHFRPLRVVKGE